MGEQDRERIEKAASDESQFCRCAGPTCSGCEPKTIRLFKKAVSWRDKNPSPEVRELVEFVLWLTPMGQGLDEPTSQVIGEKARELFSKWGTK